MSKIVDISGKLGLQGRPVLHVAEGVDAEVDNSAKTVLQIMQLVQDAGSGVEDFDAKDMLEMYELLFDAKARKRIDALHLSFEDFLTLLNSAIEMSVPGGDIEGEAATPATI